MYARRRLYSYATSPNSSELTLQLHHDVIMCTLTVDPAITIVDRYGFSGAKRRRRRARHRTTTAVTTAGTRWRRRVIVGFGGKTIKQITAGLTYIYHGTRPFLRQRTIIIVIVVVRTARFVRDERVLPTDRAFGFGPNAADAAGTLYEVTSRRTDDGGATARAHARGLVRDNDTMRRVCAYVARRFVGTTVIPG